MAFGLTPQGFNPKTTADILSSFQQVQTQQIDANLDLQPTNPLGVMNGVVADELALGWQALAAIYAGMDRDGASGVQLTSVALLTGTERLGPQKTQAIGCTVNVGAGFNAAAGAMVAAIVGTNPAVTFTNKEAVSNLLGVPANETVDFEAVNAGPQQCLAHTLTVISQPLGGWNSVDNPTDGVVGNLGETDPALRTRSSEELSGGGSSTPAAIRSAVLLASQNKLFSSSVASCTVLFNDSDAFDANGLPPHSIEVLCYQPGATPADDQALADLIADNKGGGMNTWGQTVKTHVDSQGFSEPIRFTRPATVRIYVDITVLHDPTAFPADGVAEVQAALAAYGNTVGEGNEIFQRHVQAEAFAVPGVKDVTAFTIDTVFPPVGVANIPIGVRQVPTFSTGDIAVTVT